jgi:hypothetical protein
VQRGLLLRAREGPDRTRTTLAAEDEAELLRRAQAVGVIRTERRAGLSVRAAHRADCDRSSNPHNSACGQHYAASKSLRISSRTTTAGIKPVGSRGHKPASRKCRRKRFRAAKSPGNGHLLFFRHCKLTWYIINSSPRLASVWRTRRWAVHKLRESAKWSARGGIKGDPHSAPIKQRVAQISPRTGRSQDSSPPGRRKVHTVYFQ